MDHQEGETLISPEGKSLQEGVSDGKPVTWKGITYKNTKQECRYAYNEYIQDIVTSDGNERRYKRHSSTATAVV